MNSSLRRLSFVCFASGAVLAALAPSAHAIVTSNATIQVLDQLDVFSRGGVKRSTESPINLLDLNSVGGNLKSCQNGRNGLTCLDGQMVRNWKVPKTQPTEPGSTPFAPDAGTPLFSCEDNALGLDVRNGACTSLTTDIKGSIWIAGRKSATSHNLIEIKPKVGNCNTLTGRIGTTTYSTTASSYCFYVRRTGRPLLLDISAYDNELASITSPGNPLGGSGILGVENRKTVVYFPSNSNSVFEVGAGKNDWSLNGGEQVQSAALLQRQLLNGTVQTYGAITTSTGRVMWKDLVAATAATPVANLNSLVVGLNPCETGSTANFFEIRASDTTGRFFIGNRNFCRVAVGSPIFNDNTTPSTVTLSIVDNLSTTTTFKPEGISVSPGIAVDLTKCANTVLGCDYIKDGQDPDPDPTADPSIDTNDIAAASMIGVQLASASSGLIVFQIKNIPDCRQPLLQASSVDCLNAVARGIVVQSAKGDYLNVTPMLPQEIKDLFDSTGVRPTGLPPMLISPRYHAQNQSGYKFDALFGVTDPDVVFRKSFTAQFDIGDENLVGDKLGCGVYQKDSGSPPPQQFQFWDIVTMVSERFTSVGGPTGIVTGPAGEHVDMLTNKDCFNPTAGAGTRWSMYALNLKLAESTEKEADDSTLKYSYAAPRRYLGNLLKSLYTDLGDVQTRMVCSSVDAVGNTTTPATRPPLATGSMACQTLASNWSGTQDKLFKCIDAAIDPKVSQLDQNCGAFDSQFPAYYNYVSGLTPTGPDPANRVGEVLSRLDVIRHVYYNHFLNAPLSQTPQTPAP